VRFFKDSEALKLLATMPDGIASERSSVNARGGVPSAKNELSFAQQDRIDQKNHLIRETMLNQHRNQH
jgi:hypothetical protein